MLLAPIGNFLALIGLLVLLGSLLGSAFKYFSRDGGDFVPSGDSKYGTRYGDDWRGPRQSASGVYITRQPSPPNKPRRLFGVVWVTAVGFVVGFVTLFSLQSPWSIETDLRHLVASLHCRAAGPVGLDQAQSGQPGYHPRLDPDGNGIACDDAPVEMALIPGGVPRSLSNASLTRPSK